MPSGRTLHVMTGIVSMIRRMRSSARERSAISFFSCSFAAVSRSASALVSFSSGGWTTSRFARAFDMTAKTIGRAGFGQGQAALCTQSTKAQSRSIRDVSRGEVIQTGSRHLHTAFLLEGLPGAARAEYLQAPSNSRPAVELAEGRRDGTKGRRLAGP